MTGKNITLLVLISLGVFLSNLDGSIVNIALPTLLTHFNVDTSTVSIVVIAYLLAMSNFLLLFGKLSDIKGARKIFISGFAVFLFASIMCTFSTNIYMLAFFRFIHGIGGAMLASAFGVVILQYLPSEMRGRAFGFTAVAGGTGYALGAPLGGFLIKCFDWKWIFYINIPLCALALLMAYRFLPEKKNQSDEKSGIDIISVILSFVCLCAVNLAFNKIDTDGMKSPFVLGGFAVFLVTLLLFIYRQMKIPSPLIDVMIFKHKGLSAGLIAGFLMGLLLSGTMFIFPFYFEFARNLNPAGAGMFLMIIPLLSTLLGPLAGYLSDRYGPRRITLYSTFIIIISVIMISFFNIEISTYYIVISFILFGGGLAFFLTANISLVMGYAPKGKEGITSAMAALNNTLSAVTGVSVFAAVFSYYMPEHSGNILEAVHVIKGFHICFIYFIFLSVSVFAVVLFAGERKEKNEIL